MRDPAQHFGDPAEQRAVGLVLSQPRARNRRVAKLVLRVNEGEVCETDEPEGVTEIWFLKIETLRWTTPFRSRPVPDHSLEVRDHAASRDAE
jgi:hypothetical protein